MNILRFVAGAVLAALLAVIAYDLHRVANALAPATGLSAAAAEYVGRGAETREQRIQRRAREWSDDADEMTETAALALKMRHPNPVKGKVASR